LNRDNIFTQNAHYAGDFNNSKSPYFSFSQKLKNLARQNIRKLKKDPEDVAKLIEKIIQQSHPRLRYISDISSWSRVMAQQILPPSLTSRIFRKFIHAN
jgi:hypothetical protein